MTSVRRAALTVFFLAGQSVPSYALFSNTDGSVVGESLGGAFVAKADDVQTIFVNPAGLRGLDAAEAAFSYDAMNVDLSAGRFSRSSLSLSRPAGRRFSIGAGLSSFDAAGKLSEREIIMSAAAQVQKGLLVGVSIGHLHSSYAFGGDQRAVLDPVFASRSSRSNWSVDVGALYRLGNVQLGLAGRRINQPDMGLATEDRVPRNLRAGAALRFGRCQALFEISRLDAAGTASPDGEYAWGGGVEYRIVSPLSLRGGASRDRVTGGIGLAFKDFRFDYAASLSQDGGEGIQSHRAVLRWRFWSQTESATPQPAVRTPPPAAFPPKSAVYRPGPVKRKVRPLGGGK